MMEAGHRYDGYIVHSTGDGILALFGAPVATKTTLGVRSTQHSACKMR